MCCSDCERMFEYNLHVINHEGMHIVEDYLNWGTGTYTDNGCTIEHWCGELGNWKMFQPKAIKQ